MGYVQQICLFACSELSFTIGKYAEYMYRDARAENGLPNPVLSSRLPVMQASEQKVSDIWGCGCSEWVAESTSCV
jgi:hypothetical protein